MQPSTTTTPLRQEVSGHSLGTVLAPAIAAETTDTLLLALDRVIASIDALVAAQLDAILHHERMRRLEGSWRGLNYLVKNSEIGEGLKIQLLNVTKKEISNDCSLTFYQPAISRCSFRSKGRSSTRSSSTRI